MYTVTNIIPTTLHWASPTCMKGSSQHSHVTVYITRYIVEMYEKNYKFVSGIYRSESALVAYYSMSVILIK